MGAGTSPMPMATAAVRIPQPNRGSPDLLSGAMGAQTARHSETHDAGRRESCRIQILMTVEAIQP